MSKSDFSKRFADLPATIRNETLRQLTVEKILYELSNPERTFITSKGIFDGHKPIFSFKYFADDWFLGNLNSPIETYEFTLNYYDCLEMLYMQYEELDTIEEELKKYEELQEMYDEVTKSNRALDKKVLELNKKAKAFDIIEKKEVNMFWIKQCFQEFFGLEKYNNGANIPLIREEYELLKEVMYNGQE